MTRARKPAKESKRDAFIRIGEQRMKVLIKALRTLGNLSNRNAYDYSPDDTERMVQTLYGEVEDFQKRMENRKRSVGFSFRLDDPNQLDMLDEKQGDESQQTA